MVDVSKTIAAKSDQLNADDLIGGPLTIRVQKVASAEDRKEQPIAVYYEGCDGKPYYPCKTMRRVLVLFWGKHGQNYVGKSMTLYRDPNVKYGGIVTGGIRISHMSDLDKETVIGLLEKRGSRKMFTIKPLVISLDAERHFDHVQWFKTRLAHCADTTNALNLKEKWIQTLDKASAAGKPIGEETLTIVRNMLAERHAELLQQEREQAAVNANSEIEELPA